MNNLHDSVSFAVSVTNCGYNHSQDTIHYSERVVHALRRFLHRRSEVCAHLLVISCMELNMHLSREHQRKVAALHSDKSSLVTALLSTCDSGLPSIQGVWP